MANEYLENGRTVDKRASPMMMAYAMRGTPPNLENLEKEKRIPSVWDLMDSGSFDKRMGNRFGYLFR